MYSTGGGKINVRDGVEGVGGGVVVMKLLKRVRE